MKVCIFNLHFLEGFAAEVWQRYLLAWAQRKWKTNMTFQHVLNVFHQSRQMRRSVAFGWTVHSARSRPAVWDGEWEGITRWRWLALSVEFGWSSHFSLIAIQSWTYSHVHGVNKCSVRTATRPPDTGPFHLPCGMCHLSDRQKINSSLAGVERRTNGPPNWKAMK